jgi:hypothetical protein
MECPFCGKNKVITRAIISATRHRAVDCTCPSCGREYIISREDIDREKREREERKARAPAAVAPEIPKQEEIPPKLIRYRREFGLCILCGEPSKNSRTYCEKCKEEVKRRDRQ